MFHFDKNDYSSSSLAIHILVLRVEEIDCYGDGLVISEIKCVGL